MSDAKKTHTVQLGAAPAEQVTAAELETLKTVTGPAFAQYAVTEIAEQPPKPSDSLTTKKDKAGQAE